VTVREVNNAISEGYGKRMRAAFHSKTIISGEFISFTFVEEPRFMVLSGAAGRNKTGEELSGDNFSLTELSEGQMLMGIVDGMGSGFQASSESEQIIELLEDLLRTGFEEEAALRMVNSVLLGRDQNEASTAVDLAVADLYSGTCSFIKSGAAATFIKRNQWIEMMKSTSLPVGVLREVDYENTSKKLYDGDYVIMVSDGVLEAMEGEEKEEEFMRVLMDIRAKNPKDFADEVLEKALEIAGGEVRDDMTVLVTGIWEKAS
jgi:stage II sporulation protein E